MKRTKKLLALLLCIVMCLSLFPVSAFAADEEPAEDLTDEAAVTEVTDEGQGEETDDPADPAAPADGQDAEGEDGTDADPADPADPADGEGGEPAEGEGDGTDPAGEPEEGEEPEDGEEAEEEEPVELPCGFAGMPEGYEFSEEELAAKRVLTEMGIVSALRNGGSYVEGELMVNTTSQEYAELVAQAYCAELVSFNGFFALIRLSDATVPEAVEAAADMELPLPAVEPNWISYEAPVYCELAEPDFEEQALTTRYWQDWYNYIGSGNADPLLRYPANADYQWQHDVVHSFTAWGVTTGNTTVRVAVIDSGVNYNHTDLSGKVILGRDYVGNDNAPLDENGHGTHVAGIIAGKMGNGNAGAGIAPNVQLIAIRVCDADGFYDTANLVNGIYNAISNGADIINLSLSEPYYNSSLKNAVDYAYNYVYSTTKKGVTIIAAMGNEGSNIKKYPAAYDHVIAVGATNRDGSRASFSNYGSWCDISAPGVEIYSTLGSSTGVKSGTSQATPIVSGVAALYMSVFGHQTPAQMEKILKGATNKGAGSGMGKGIIDAAKIFKGKKNLPTAIVYASDGVIATDGTAARDGYIRLESGSGETTADVRFLYTVDGSDPAVMDGQAVNGQDVSEWGLYDEEQGCYLLPLASFAVGENVRFKFMEVEAGAIPGEIAEVEVTITASEADFAEIRVGISGAGKLRLGQSTVLTAEVSGTLAAEGVETQQLAMPDQTVVWSVAEPAGDPRVSVDENGTVTVSRDFDGDRIVIRAESTVYVDANGDPVSATFVIDVSELLQIGSIRLAGAVPTLYTGEVWNPELVITDTEGSPMSVADAGLAWTSSNEQVARVVQTFDEETGLCTVAVIAEREGSVKLTGAATDGSGKGVTFMATVKPSVSSVTISGQRVVQTGTTVAFKAAVLPKNAGNKTLTWSLTGAPSGVTIDSVTGKVTVPDNTSLVGKTFTVRAQATTGTPGTYSVTVDRKSSGVSLSTASSVQVYSVNVPETSAVDNRITISATRTGGVNNPNKGIVWSGGNASIATFSDNGSGTITITAKKAGKVTFTAKAMDGSNKSAKVTVKVITPASSISIVSKTKEETQYIGYGKSAKNKAVLGSSYGKPSVSKVAWDYFIETKSSSSASFVNNTSLKTQMKNDKLITISSSGTLSLKAKAETWLSGYYDYRIKVTANTTDRQGTGSSDLSDYVYYFPIELTKYISLYEPGHAGNSYYEFSRRYLWMISKSDGPQQYVFEIFGTSKNGTRTYSDYSVKSSNPNCLAAFYQYDGYEKLTLVFDPNAKTGNVKITITACDGSNKSITYRFRVTK